MNWDAFATTASVISLLVVAWQLRSLAKQTKASTQTVRAAVHLTTFTSAVGIDTFFVDHPDLRESFYGRIDGPGEQATLQRIDATAEMLLDQFMMAATQIDHMSDDLREGWHRYTQHVWQNSPALQGFFRRHRDWYDLIERDGCFVLPGSPKRLGWHRHNSAGNRGPQRRATPPLTPASTTRS
jgi:hypothetical protein